MEIDRYEERIAALERQLEQLKELPHYTRLMMDLERARRQVERIRKLDMFLSVVAGDRLGDWVE